ncbi:hypothetical protein Cal7507_0625 [Calothrix sp. PCC 7507]|nr:hypothetical protein Cal7507_0625 [Calothrix sp. PCC 7507]
MSFLEEVDRLIDNLAEQEKVILLTKKFREMPLEIRYQLFQELRSPGLMEFVGSDICLDDIVLQIQTDQNIDISSVLELLVEHHRQKKNQGN